MVLKFNDDNIISNLSFYYNYVKLCVFLIYIKIFNMLNYKEKLYDCIYQLCLFGGPIFIKIAQNISNKEMIDYSLRKRLIKFQDNNFDYCKNSYDSNYLIEKYNLDSISEKPLFAGSIAAVYKCKYKNKNSVLKIIHPNIKYNTIMSINLFDKLVSNINMANYNLNQIISMNDLYQEVLNQIDFNLEYKNLIKIKENFKDFNNLVIIPEVYHHNTEFLIESFEDGYKFTEFIKLYPEKSQEAYYLLCCCFFKMFFDNYVHVDFHESNLRFILDNNKVKIIIFDFGMVSKIHDKKIYLSLLNIYKKNIFLADPYKLVDLFIKLNTNSNCDIKKFKQNIYDYIQNENIDENLNTIINEKVYQNDKTQNLNTYNVIKYIIDQAILLELKICDTIFNMLNSFILIEDFFIKIENRNPNSYKSHQEKMKYAQDNGFINDIKKSFSKTLN